jgi:N-acylneuraminate cytidylyltransferase
MVRNNVAIILARGGSKGIPHKNIVDFCGKPLLQWTIDQLKNSKFISSIWVSSDDLEILRLARHFGVETIFRSKDISGDKATSESGWLHAINFIEEETGKSPDLVVAPQVTSPIRESKDFDEAITKFYSKKLDSMFSVCDAEDLCLWCFKNGDYFSDSYDMTNPNRRRQDFEKRYIENGSFYLFTPKVLRKFGVRFGIKRGMHVMDHWKSFEIDDPEDLIFCEVVMKALLDGRLSNE